MARKVSFLEKVFSNRPGTFQGRVRNRKGPYSNNMYNIGDSYEPKKSRDDRFELNSTLLVQPLAMNLPLSFPSGGRDNTVASSTLSSLIGAGAKDGKMILNDEVKSMLKKRAIRVVDLKVPGDISGLFARPKKERGKFHLIISMKYTNSFIVYQKFRMTFTRDI